MGRLLGEAEEAVVGLILSGGRCLAMSVEAGLRNLVCCYWKLASAAGAEADLESSCLEECFADLAGSLVVLKRTVSAACYHICLRLRDPYQHRHQWEAVSSPYTQSAREHSEPLGCTQTMGEPAAGAVEMLSRRSSLSKVSADPGTNVSMRYSQLEVESGLQWLFSPAAVPLDSLSCGAQRDWAEERLVHVECPASLPAVQPSCVPEKWQHLSPSTDRGLWYVICTDISARSSRCSSANATQPGFVLKARPM